MGRRAILRTLLINPTPIILSLSKGTLCVIAQGLGVSHVELVRED